MGYVHHSVYPEWFERARTELLRGSGVAYSQVEREGLFIVVVKLAVNYHKPASYDDEVTVTAHLRRSSGARIEHDYTVRRGEAVLCTGATTLACVNADGRVVPVPPRLCVEG